MCVQLRTLSPCAAAEGYLSIIVPILTTLSLPNALPVFFFLLGEGAWGLGYIPFYQIWSSKLRSLRKLEPLICLFAELS